MLILFHLKELQYRLFYVFITFLINHLICFSYSEEICFYMAKPLIVSGGKYYFIFTDLRELFIVYLYNSLFFALFFSIFIFFLQIIFYLSSGLYKHELKFIILYLYFFFSFFFLFFSLSYYYIIPFIWNFFLTMEISNIIHFKVLLEPKISDYIFFSLKIYTLIMIICVFPIVCMVFIQFKWMTGSTLIYQRHWFLIFNLIFSAFISPPDVISQLLVALCFFLFYEITLWWIEYNKLRSLYKE